MLIQLLNIAGIGPVIGVILGIKFGSIVFIVLPLGNLIAGATHDMLAGMMSLRKNGANLTTLVQDNLGKVYYNIFSWFMVVLLLLVVAVFVNIPANLIDGMIKMMDQPPEIGGPVNLGNPAEFTMLELAQTVLELTNSNSQLVFRELPPDDPKQRRPDISKAKSILNWEPTIQLKEGLTHTIAYFEQLLKDAPDFCR